MALRISIETGADFATAVALLSGAGTLGGAGAFLLRKGGVNLVKDYLTKNGAVSLIKYSAGTGLRASLAETGLRYSAVPLGGSRSAADRALVGLGIGSIGAIAALPVVGVGVRATGLSGPAFRAVSTGRFVGDVRGIFVYTGPRALGTAPAYVNIYLNN